jgi:hypothetical protein
MKPSQICRTLEKYAKKNVLVKERCMNVWIVSEVATQMMLMPIIRAIHQHHKQ